MATLLQFPVLSHEMASELHASVLTYFAFYQNAYFAFRMEFDASIRLMNF